MKRIIPYDKSLIVSLDVTDTNRLAFIVEALKGVPSIGGFKIGLTLAAIGLIKAVELIKNAYGGDIPIIYDHQKAANDIPAIGKAFAKMLKDAGITAAILFPFTGPATETRWIQECFINDIDVIVGGIMTHEQFLVSEGGYISDDAPTRIYNLAAAQGVKHFVVPGTKLNWVTRIRTQLEEWIPDGDFALYAPGFGTQQGDLEAFAHAAGHNWHAIVGSAIYTKTTRQEIHNSALEIIQFIK